MLSPAEFFIEFVHKIDNDKNLSDADKRWKMQSIIPPEQTDLDRLSDELRHRVLAAMELRQIVIQETSGVFLGTSFPRIDIKNEKK